jgi:prepilin-type N-terminal cleavage/methylation domain-containing protein
MKLIRNTSAGFTLIELIVAFTIIAILSVMSVGAYVNYSRTQAVNNEASYLIAALNTAKARAQSQVKPDECTTSLNSATNETLSEYSVIIQPSNYRLIAKCAGASIPVTIESGADVHSFASPITASGSYTITFNVLSGTVSPSPTTITLTGSWAGQNISKAITINLDGTIQ